MTAEKERKHESDTSTETKKVVIREIELREWEYNKGESNRDRIRTCKSDRTSRKIREKEREIELKTEVRDMSIFLR